MKSKFLLCFIFLFQSLTVAQGSSSLFQLITSDLIVQQTKVNREFQTFLSKEIDKEYSGLTIPIVRDEIDNLKQDILNFISNVTLPDSKKLKQQTDTTRIRLAKEIETFINKKLKISVDMEKFIGGVLKNYMGETPLKIFSDGDLKKSSDTVAELFANYVYYDLLKVNQFIGEITKDAENVKKDFRISTISFFDEVQTEFNEKIEKPIGENVKGTLGVKVEGEDQIFNGGLLFNLRKTDWWKLAIFLNTDINAPGDAAGVRSLFGGKGVVVCNIVQIDFLVATYFGAKEFHKLNGWEFGLGLNFKVTEESVLGIAGFLQKNSDISGNTFFSAGLSYKFSQDYPAIILGVADDGNEKSRLFFQIHQPIFLN